MQDNNINKIQQIIWLKIMSFKIIEIIGNTLKLIIFNLILFN